MPEETAGSGNATEELADLLIRLFNKAAAIEQNPVDTGDGTFLYPSEVHLIDMAGRFPGESMTQLASRLGITRSAISQTAKKLDGKGYLERYSREGDNRTILLRLTRRGEHVFRWHRVYHAAVNDRISRRIATLAPGERDAIMEVFAGFEQVFEDCPETQHSVTMALKDDQDSGPVK